MMNKKFYWITWISLSILLASYYANALVGEDKSLFLPGETSAGHYQIEMACTQCHSESFSDDQVLQKACVKCHGKELKSVEDSHPKSKFTDPRNADRTAILDARLCITCHREHQPGITGEMGVTLPKDFCKLCHFDIEEDRPSHKGMVFDTCANAGCHNFHDNEALYEDFLVKHMGEKDTTPGAVVPARNLKSYYEERSGKPVAPLFLEQHDAPSSAIKDNKLLVQWAYTEHAGSAVNCSACHREKSDRDEWIDKPDHKACKQCHELELNGFYEGKHGMRLRHDLSPMQVGMARQTMDDDASHDSLDCMSCHKDHTFDTTKAAVEACLSCHDDDHSNAYKKSPHYELWLKESSGEAPRNTGVSCATCHMPRVKRKQNYIERTVVVHNQNMNLRPNEKMIRSVCMNCHGLALSIDALADKQLVKNNFNDMPSKHIESIEMAKKRELLKQKEKQGKKKPS